MENNSIKTHLENYKSNIPILLLIFYSLGYIYLDRYYGCFGIPIVSYINLTDIIFVTIETLIRLVLIYLILEFCLYFSSYIILQIYYSPRFNKKLNKRIATQKVYDRYKSLIVTKKIIKKINGVTLGVFTVIISISGFCIDEGLFTLLSLIFPLFVLKLYQAAIYEHGTDNKRGFQILLIFIYIILIICFAIWGHNNGNDQKSSTTSQVVELYEKEKLYSTSSDSLNYIGETSSYLFMYDKINRYTLIFNKQNISNLKFKDSTLTTEEKQKIQDEREKIVNDFLKRGKRN